MRTTSGYEIFTPCDAEPDWKAVEQLATCMFDERAVAGALMADHHLGYSMPIGGVVAYDGAISPSGVGFDIACGNKAVQTDMAVSDLYAEDGSPLPEGYSTIIKSVMRDIQRRVEFGIGRSNATPVEHDLFYLHADVLSLLDGFFGSGQKLTQKARAQLGTVGSGNHYVDLLADEDGVVWVANHFGSRGLGHTIATGFLNLADNRGFTEKGAEKEEPTVIPADTDLGRAYIAAMYLAGDYAYAGRDYVIDQVLDILGAESTFSVHNHHNFAWLEDGLWVVRKGATPLTTQPAYIGGSMLDGAVIVKGRPLTDPKIHNWVEDIGALGSAPHGAGRVMSRTKAAGKFKKFWTCTNRDCDWKELSTPGLAIPECPDCGSTRVKKLRMRDESTAAVDWGAVRADLTEQGIVVLGSGADEAPAVYKDLDDVIAAHSNIEVVHRLRPLGVVMAGSNTFDPYKD